MNTTVLLFASFRERMKVDRLNLDLPEGFLAGDIITKICSNEAEAASWRRVMRVAVNNCFVPHDTLLHDGDEVALIPPMAGG